MCHCVHYFWAFEACCKSLAVLFGALLQYAAMPTAYFQPMQLLYWMGEKVRVLQPFTAAPVNNGQAEDPSITIIGSMVLMTHIRKARGIGLMHKTRKILPS